MAEEDVVKSYIDRTLNQQAQGFDDSMRRQIDYSSLITVCNLSPLNYKQGFNSAVSGNTAEAVISSGTRQAGNLLRAGYTPKNLGSIEIAHQPTGDKTEYINLITNPSIVSWLSRIYADKLHISDNYDIAYDSKTNEELKVYTFSTRDTNAATLYNNQIWYGKKMFDEVGVGSQPLYIIVEYDRAPKRAIVRLVDINSVSKYPVRELDEFSFTGVLYREMVSPPTGRIPEDQDNPDFKGSMEMNVEGAASLVTYATIYLDANEPNIAYSDPVGRGSLNYCYSEPIHKMDDANFRFLDLTPKTVFFDKTVNTASPVVRSVMNGGYLTNTRAIEVVSKSSWLNASTTKRNGEFYCDISLNPANGTNNTGKIREGYVDVVSYKQLEGGATETYTGRIYVFQYTTDTPVPAGIGLDVTPSKLTFDGIYGYEERKSVVVVVEGGADYSVSLKNPADTWLHIEKRENIAGGETLVWCDANDSDSERVGYIVFTAGEGVTETIKEVMVVQTPSDRLNPPEIKTTEDTIYFASTAGETKILYIDLKRAPRYSISGYDYGDYSPWFVIGTEYSDRIEVICTQDNLLAGSRTGYFTISATSDADLTTTVRIKVVQGANEAAEQQHQQEQQEESSKIIKAEPEELWFDADVFGADSFKEISIVTSSVWGTYSTTSELLTQFLSYYSYLIDYGRQVVKIWPNDKNVSNAVKSGTLEISTFDGKNKVYLKAYQKYPGMPEATSESLMISVIAEDEETNDNHVFNFGIEGGEKPFTKLKVTGGTITDISTFEPYWSIKYKNTLSTENNPLGAYVSCEPNTTGVFREDSVTITVKSSTGNSKISVPIYINQKGTPDTNKQKPVINCVDSIEIGAAADSMLFEVTFSNLDPEIVNPCSAEAPVDSFLTVGAFNSTGLSLSWGANNTGEDRPSSFKISATNNAGTTEKTVNVTQKSSGTTQTEAYLVVKGDTNRLVKALTPENEIIEIDTNCTYVTVTTGYADDSGDDWAVVDDLGSGRYSVNCRSYPNPSSEPRIAGIRFDGTLDESSVSAIVWLVQDGKPEVILGKTLITDYPWGGGNLEVPFTVGAINAETLKIAGASTSYMSVGIDPENSKLNINISPNTSGKVRTLYAILSGENHAHEEATAKIEIIQGTKPVNTDDSGSSTTPGTTPGGSGSGSDQPSSGTDSTDTSNAVYSTNFDERGIIFRLPKRILTNSYTQPSTDVLFILQEKLLVKSPSDSQYSFYTIKPISYTEYDRLMSKAYASPMKRQAWRLFQNQSTGFDILSEIIPANAVNVTNSDIVYRIRYVRRPKPIILEDLPDGLQIDGYTKETTCEINPILHQDILVRAVQLALASKGRQTNSTEKQ